MRVWTLGKLWEDLSLKQANVWSKNVIYSIIYSIRVLAYVFRCECHNNTLSLSCFDITQHRRKRALRSQHCVTSTMTTAMMMHFIPKFHEMKNVMKCKNAAFRLLISSAFCRVLPRPSHRIVSESRACESAESQSDRPSVSDLIGLFILFAVFSSLRSLFCSIRNQICFTLWCTEFTTHQYFPSVYEHRTSKDMTFNNIYLLGNKRVNPVWILTQASFHRFLIPFYVLPLLYPFPLLFFFFLYLFLPSHAASLEPTKVIWETRWDPPLAALGLSLRRNWI